MTANRPADTPPSGPDGDGVRVVGKARAARRPALSLALAASVAIVLALVWRFSAPAPARAAVEVTQPAGMSAEKIRPGAMPAATRGRATVPTDEAIPLPSGDPDDLASYFAPGDPEPTGAELIEALHDMGIRTGIGAFNPPGTSPVLEGIPVPDDYELPEGYARHHQWTDEGEPIGAILMYSPGYTHLGPDGRPITVPDNGVVPPHLAPPGL